MILTIDQAGIAVASFYDARLMGAEVSVTFPQAAAFDQGDRIVVRKNSVTPAELYDGPLMMAEAYGLYIVEVRFASGRVLNCTVTSDVTAEEFAMHFEGSRIREFRVVR